MSNYKLGLSDEEQDKERRESEDEEENFFYGKHLKYDKSLGVYRDTAVSHGDSG